MGSRRNRFLRFGVAAAHYYQESSCASVFSPRRTVERSNLQLASKPAPCFGLNHSEHVRVKGLRVQFRKILFEASDSTAGNLDGFKPSSFTHNGDNEADRDFPPAKLEKPSLQSR